MLCVLSAWTWHLRATCAATDHTKERAQRYNAAYEIFIDGILHAEGFVGMPFPKVELMDLHGQVISTDFSERRGGLVLLFYPTSCQACVITQLKSFQKIFEGIEYPEEFPLYAIAKSTPAAITRFTRPFGLEYTLAADPKGLLLGSPLAKVTPVVFVVNGNNTVIGCHVPSKGKPEQSIIFFENIYKRQIGRHLQVGTRLPYVASKDIRPIDMIRNEFDPQRVAHLLP